MKTIFHNLVNFSLLKKNIFLIIALLLPIVALLVLTASRVFTYHTGRILTLSVEGYDPRSILSGHYIQYRVNYGDNSACLENSHRYDSSGTQTSENYKIFFCFREPDKIPAVVSDITIDRQELVDCGVVIEGKCNGGRFVAGIEKFYVNEHLAKDMDERLRGEGKAFIRVKVDKSHDAQVIDFLFEDELKLPR